MRTFSRQCPDCCRRAPALPVAGHTDGDGLERAAESAQRPHANVIMFKCGDSYLAICNHSNMNVTQVTRDSDATTLDPSEAGNSLSVMQARICCSFLDVIRVTMATSTHAVSRNHSSRTCNRSTASTSTRTNNLDARPARPVTRFAETLPTSILRFADAAYLFAMAQSNSECTATDITFVKTSEACPSSTRTPTTCTSKFTANYSQRCCRAYGDREECDMRRSAFLCYAMLTQHTPFTMPHIPFTTSTITDDEKQ